MLEYWKYVDNYHAYKWGTSMARSAKLQERGQITLPKAVREAFNLKPGDSVVCVVEGPGTFRLEVVQRMTLAEMVARYAVDEPYDEAANCELWQEEAADEAMRG